MGGREGAAVYISVDRGEKDVLRGGRCVIEVYIFILCTQYIYCIFMYREIYFYIIVSIQLGMLFDDLYLSIDLCIYLCIYLCICLCICPCNCLCIYLSMLGIYLSIFLSFYLSVYSSLYLSVYAHIYISSYIYNISPSLYKYF